jgi:hypothetical protein
MSTQNHHFSPRVITSVLLEHLLLRSDPMLRLFRQALPFLYLQTDVSFVCVPGGASANLMSSSCLSIEYPKQAFSR